MKKIKLITSLSSLGVIACATPIVATSCADNTKSAEMSKIVWQQIDNDSIIASPDILTPVLGGVYGMTDFICEVEGDNNI